MRCHQAHALDLARLLRDGVLVPGRSATTTWSRGGEVMGSIGLFCEAHGLRLVYRMRRRDEDWTNIDELVPFIETPLHFGGSRQWFRCLGCGRRCRIIYGGSYFRCRRCHGLTYETQYESATDRATTRARKIRERLGGEGGLDDFFPLKPKGMHWRTYERLAREAEHLDLVWAEAVARRFEMFDDMGG